MADVFHSGSGGTNCTAGGCCFNTPRGKVHSTASHLYMKVCVVERGFTAITSQPGEQTKEGTLVHTLLASGESHTGVIGAHLMPCIGPAELLCLA